MVIRTDGPDFAALNPGYACCKDSSLLLDIEEPLRDATHYVEALRLIGHGLVLRDEIGGDAVAALARIAALRLRAVEEVWNKVLDERRRQKS